MHTSTQTSGLARFASAFSGAVDRQLNAISEAAVAKLRSEAAKRGAHTRAHNARRAREEPLTAARLKLARKGLGCVLELGENESIEKILDSLDRIEHYSRGHFILYSASRLAGGAWEDPKYEGPAGTRDVIVALEREHLVLSYGAGAIAQMTNVELAYVAAETAARDEEIGRLFVDIAGPYAADMKLVQNKFQRKYDWEPEDVLFQFLVNCADKKRFAYYLARAAARLERSIRENIVLN